MTGGLGVPTNPQARDDLWRAVDALTKPTTRRLDRDRLDEEPWLRGLLCDVGTYRAAVKGHGEIPSLWDQAEAALNLGRELSEGGASAGALRSPADLDLMELLLTVRESMAWQLPGRGITPKPGMRAQMRQLASHVIAHEPQHIEWWAYRFDQWARMLAVYLQAIDTGPKPVRLRNAPCPLCRTRQVTLDTDQGPVVVPPIVIDFVNGWIRAATCIACSATWWRGDDLGRLADQLERDTPSPVVADVG